MQASMATARVWGGRSEGTVSVQHGDGAAQLCALQGHQEVGGVLVPLYDRGQTGQQLQRREKELRHLGAVVCGVS